MANVAAPQSASSGQAEAVATLTSNTILALNLEINKQKNITLAGGSPTWTTADTLYTALKA